MPFERIDPGSRGAAQERRPGCQPAGGLELEPEVKGTSLLPLKGLAHLRRHQRRGCEQGQDGALAGRRKMSAPMMSATPASGISQLLSSCANTKSLASRGS